MQPIRLDRLLRGAKSGQRVALPAGTYFGGAVINVENFTLCSADPLNPAVIISDNDHLLNKPLVTISKASCTIEHLVFAPSFQCDALSIRASGCTIRNNLFKTCVTAILAEWDCLIENNTIIQFSQDGIRFCGDHTTIKNNTIGWLVLLDDEHAHHDCVQAWAGDINTPFRSKGRYDALHTLSHVRIENNHLFDIPNSPLQGITFFDGLHDRWVITGNHVHLFSNHPLTLRGGGDSVAVECNFLSTGDYQALPARRWLASLKQWEEVQVA